MRRLPVLAAVLALALAGAVSACGGDEEPAGTSEPASTQAASTAEASTPDATTAEETTSAADPETTTAEEPAASTAASTPAGTQPVAIYLVRGEKVSPVRRQVDGSAPARGAIAALLEGPGADDGDRITAIPAGTRLLDVAMDGAGLLSVDLSGEFGSGGGTLSMRLRLAQVVYTASQFPTVTGVAFRLDGEPIAALGGEGIIVEQPQTPADYEDETPGVLVQEPLPGDEVSCPVHATGTSNMFEATSQMGVATDEGELPAVPTVVTATSGTGTRGTFDVEVPCTAPAGGKGFLVSWWDDAKDGSPRDVEHIPLSLR